VNPNQIIDILEEAGGYEFDLSETQEEILEMMRDEIEEDPFEDYFVHFTNNPIQ
jgi:hypothetical protein